MTDVNDFVLWTERDGVRRPICAERGKTRKRFAWGEPSRRSAIWLVETSPKGDVYVRERITGQFIHTSLHASGQMHRKWTSKKLKRSAVAKQVVARTGSLYEEIWHRPQPYKGGPFTHAFTIFTTGSDITPSDPKDVLPDDIVWLREPAIGEYAALVIGFLKPNEEIHFKGFEDIVHVAALDALEECAVILSQRSKPLDDKMAQRVAATRAAIAAAMPNVENPEYVRAVGSGDNGQGSRFAFDLAYKPCLVTVS